MNITRYAPWNWFGHEEGHKKAMPGHLTSVGRPSPMFQLHNEIDRLFNDAFRDFPGITHSFTAWPEDITAMMTKPKLDIKGTDDHYTITVEIPGVAKEDVDIRLDENVMTLSGTKKQETKEDKENYHCVERHYGRFERVLTLPQDAVVENIDAQFKDGVLTLNIKRKAIPKSKEGTKVEVKAA